MIVQINRASYLSCQELRISDFLPHKSKDPCGGGLVYYKNMNLGSDGSGKDMGWWNYSMD
jgi:hypothetical protein